MSRSKLLAVVGVILGLSICAVGGFVDQSIYGCSKSPCAAVAPPEDVVGGYVFYGGMAIILVSVAALVYSSRYPKAVSKVLSLVLVIGLIVLVAGRLYYVDPIIFIPNVTLSGPVVSPTNATPTQVSFVVCTVELSPPNSSSSVARCDPAPSARSYGTTVQQGSYSISLPNGLSYNATVTYAQGLLCGTQFVTLTSYSFDMVLTGALGCY